MTDIQINLLILSGIILFIEIYSETHLKNYGSFSERTIFLFSVKTIFNILKISILFGFSFTLLKLENLFFQDEMRLNYIFSFNINYLHYYLAFPFLFFLGALLTNSKELFQQLQMYNVYNVKVNQLLANIKYLIFRLLSFTITYLIFAVTFYYIIKLDKFFTMKGLSIFDWLDYEGNSIDNYNRGVYFSLLLTTILFFLFNNAFIKINSSFWDYRRISLNFFKYFFITIILSLGLFFGFFSILNASYNILNSSLSEWVTKENILGILPIRVSSLLIVMYLLSYIYKEIIDRKLYYFLLLGILPIRNLRNYSPEIKFNSKETLFFCQISFYILNVALSEMFFIIGIKSVLLSILNFAILFILDDFKIISDYSSGLSTVVPSHFIRIWIFNILMFITSICHLSTESHYLLLIAYIFFTIILLRYYAKNFSYIRLRRPIL